MLNVPPIMVPKEKGFGKEPNFWEAAKRSVLNRPRLIIELQEFEKDNIDLEIIS